MSWEHLLARVLGLFSGTIERRLRGRFAIKETNQIFGHITRFIAELNETLSKNLPPGLVSSAGVSLTGCSQQGDDIINSLRLRSLRKQEMIIPLRIAVGTDQVKIGEVSLLLSDSEGSCPWSPAPSRCSPPPPPASGSHSGRSARRPGTGSRSSRPDILWTILLARANLDADTKNPFCIIQSQGAPACANLYSPARQWPPCLQAARYSSGMPNRQPAALTASVWPLIVSASWRKRSSYTRAGGTAFTPTVGMVRVGTGADTISGAVSDGVGRRAGAAGDGVKNVVRNGGSGASSDASSGIEQLSGPMR